MSTWTLVPVRGFDSGKTRLAGVLPAAGRRALNAAMLKSVLDAVAGAQPGSLAQCIVVSPDAEALAFARSRGAQALAEDGDAGLNAALESARGAARAQHARTLLVLAADLPDVNAAALSTLCRAVPAGAAAVIADKAGSGTNGLLLPAAAPLAFSFGEGSLARHRAALAGLGIETHVWNDPALAFDLDTAADLAAWKSAHAGADRSLPR